MSVLVSGAFASQSTAGAAGTGAGVLRFVVETPAADRPRCLGEAKGRDTVSGACLRAEGMLSYEGFVESKKAV